MKQHLMLLAILFICALLTALPACDQSTTPGTQAPSPAPSRPAPASTATPRSSPIATTTPWPSLTPYISPTPTPTPNLPAEALPWEFYLDGLHISGVVFDDQGNTWVGTQDLAWDASDQREQSEKGVAIVTTDGQWRMIQSATSGLVGDQIYALARDSAGNLWFDTDGGLCVRAPTDEWTTYPDRRAAVEAHYEDILQSHSQSPLWAIDAKHQVVWTLPRSDARSQLPWTKDLWAYDGQRWVNWPLDDGSRMNYMAVDSDSNIWVDCTPWSLCVLEREKGWRSITRANSGVHSRFITTVVADQAGNVWVGTYDRGLSVRWADGSWQTYTPLNVGLPDAAVFAIGFDEQDNAWSLTNKGVSVRWADGTWTTLPLQSIWADDLSITGVTADPVGNVWAWGGEGLYYLPAAVVEQVRRNPLLTPTPSIPPSLLTLPEQKILTGTVTLVDAWEHDDGGHRANWDWSTSGLAFIYEDMLWIAQSPGFERRLASQTTGYRSLTSPRWSPDGKYIAFEAGFPYQLMVFCAYVPADGSDFPTWLAGPPGRAANIIDWTDERTLTLAGHRGTGANPLYRVDVETGALDFIFEGSGYYWSPNHDRIAVFQDTLPPRLRLIDAEGYDLGAIGTESLACIFNDWAPSGNQFLYTQASLSIWDVLQHQGHVILSGAWGGVWSPDGRYIACWRADTPMGLVIVDGHTEQVRAQIPIKQQWLWTRYPEWSDVSLAWSPDSTHLVCRDGRMDWWIVPMTTLQPRRLTEGLRRLTEKSTLVWSPDSRYLALITPARILILEP